MICKYCGKTTTLLDCSILLIDDESTMICEECAALCKKFLGDTHVETIEEKIINGDLHIKCTTSSECHECIGLMYSLGFQSASNDLKRIDSEREIIFFIIDDVFEWDYPTYEKQGTIDFSNAKTHLLESD